MDERELARGALARNRSELPAAPPDGESAVGRFLPDLEFVVRVGHSRSVEALAFSPTGTTLATGSYDATVKLWNLSNGRLMHTLEKHYQEISALTFAPGGRILAAGSRDESVSLWDTETGGVLLEVLQDGTPDSIAFDAAGDFGASCSDGLLSVWNARTGSKLRTEKFGEYQTCLIAADAHANLLAIASSGRIEVQDFHSGRRRQRLPVGDEDIKLLAFSGDSARLTAVFSGGKVRVWSTSGWTLVAEMQIDGRCEALAVDPVSGRIAAAKPKEISQWDVETGKLVARWESEEVSSLAFSGNGQFLGEGSSEGSTRVWAADGDLRLWLEGYGNSVESLSLDSRASRVAALSASAVTVWDLQRCALRYSLRPPGEYVQQAAFHGPDGRLTALSSSELAVYDGATGRCLHVLWRGRESVEEFAVNPQGTLVAAKVDKTQVSLWDGHGLPVCNLPIDELSDGNVAFDPSGELLAVGEFPVSVWEVRTGRKLWQFKGSFPVSFHPSGSALAVDSSRQQGGTAAIYDLRTGKVIRRVGMPDNPGSFTEDVDSIHFSSSGRYLAASYFWGQVHVWEVTTGKHVGNLEKWTRHIAVHPADDILAASQSENCITLWNTSLQQLGSLQGVGARCSDAMCFDRTGKMLVTGLIDGRVMVWSVARRQWVATFLPVSRYQWITYTREGHFIGSNDVEDAVSMSMYFGRGKRSYPASALTHPRDNPNPEKVAAALTLGQEDARGETAARRDGTAVAGEPPKLLGAPEP